MAYRTLHLHLFSYQSEKRRTAYRVARLVYSRSHAGKGVAMEVKLAVLADYANVSQDGKLNIMGIFQEINAPSLPFPLPQMFLVVPFEEAGDYHFAILVGGETKDTVPLHVNDLSKGGAQ